MSERHTAKGEQPSLPNDSPAPQPIDPATGQHKDYWVLSPEERAKGWVRPYREEYIHSACGVVTRMSRPIAETYARDPKYYGATFCVACKDHFPLDQFTWDDETHEKVGS